LEVVAKQLGLLLTLDGLAPEGGEPQLWLVRELLSGVTLRCGWMSQQDQTAFVNFLRPIADLGLRVTAVLSDKQTGLLPAVAEVFPQAKHAFCQIHYLHNIAAPMAEADEAMKVRLRQGVREAIGEWICQEKEENEGVRLAMASNSRQFKFNAPAKIDRGIVTHCVYIGQTYGKLNLSEGLVPAYNTWLDQ
jgi:hypothetical protein